jgi:hypothetical protein
MSSGGLSHSVVDNWVLICLADRTGRRRRVGLNAEVLFKTSCCGVVRGWLAGLANWAGGEARSHRAGGSSLGELCRSQRYLYMYLILKQVHTDHPFLHPTRRKMYTTIQSLQLLG